MTGVGFLVGVSLKEVFFGIEVGKLLRLVDFPRFEGTLAAAAKFSRKKIILLLIFAEFLQRVRIHNCSSGLLF